MTHHKPYGSELIAVNKVCRSIVLLLEDIIVLLYGFLYDILCLMLSFSLLTVF